MGLVSGLMLTLTTAARKGVRSKSRKKKIEQPKKRESNLVLFCNLPEKVGRVRLV